MIDSGREWSKAHVLDSFPRLNPIAAELDIYSELLIRWQAKLNLVGPSTLPLIWLRHFADSAQLVEVFEPDGVWADLGSGAGFPGMVIALLQKAGGGETHLIEADIRKAAFLREVSRETGARAIVHAQRAEGVLPTIAPAVITSRAMTSIDGLFKLSRYHVENGAVGLFLKGRDVVSELTKASIPSNFEVSLTPSRVDVEGCLVQIRLRR